MRIVPKNPDAYRKKFISSVGRHSRLRRFVSEEIVPRFKSQKRCVIYALPYKGLRASDRAMILHDKVMTKLMAENPLTDEENTLLSIIDHTQAPRYVMSIAREYIRRYFRDENFIAVHWRYNRKDFISRSCVINPQIWRIPYFCRRMSFRHFCNKDPITAKVCSTAKQFTALDFVDRIVEKKSYLKVRGTDVRHVYIASPKTERSFISDVSKILRDKQGLAVSSSLHLEKFLSSNYKSCDFLVKTHLQDILSTIEMEVCRSATMFLRSIRSSWSENVAINRLISRNETWDRSNDSTIFAV